MTLLCSDIFLIFIFRFLWILFYAVEKEIPGINLQMSISAKVDDIMTKIADCNVKWSNVCCISSFLKSYHK